MFLIQGHRGFSENYPENTILSFDKAIKEGANAIELDVKKTKDGKFVIMHDYTVDRTTNGTGYVTSLNWDYISTLDAGSWKDFIFTGIKVPTLDQVLSKYKNKLVFLVLHFKVGNITNIKTLVDKVAEHNMLNQVHFSGSMEDINYIKSYNSNCFTQNDAQPNFTNYKPVLQNAITYGHNAVSISEYDSLENLITMINEIHLANKLAHVSYIYDNYTNNMQKLLDAKTDLILGNDVSAMVDFINSKNIVQSNPTYPPFISGIKGGYVKTPQGIKEIDTILIKKEGKMTRANTIITSQ